MSKMDDAKESKIYELLIFRNMEMCDDCQKRQLKLLQVLASGILFLFHFVLSLLVTF